MPEDDDRSPMLAECALPPPRRGRFEVAEEDRCVQVASDLERMDGDQPEDADVL